MLGKSEQWSRGAYSSLELDLGRSPTSGGRTSCYGALIANLGFLSSLCQHPVAYHPESHRANECLRLLEQR